MQPYPKISYKTLPPHTTSSKRVMSRKNYKNLSLAIHLGLIFRLKSNLSVWEKSMIKKNYKFPITFRYSKTILLTDNLYILKSDISTVVNLYDEYWRGFYLYNNSWNILNQGNGHSGKK